MRNHIVIVSEESVFAGHYQTGIGEVVDTLANTLRKYYDVTVITPGNSRGGKVGSRVRLGVYDEEFYTAAAEMVNQIQPDLVHNFGRPDFIDQISVECPKVLSFDRWEEDIADQLDSVPKYDHVVTLSSAYASEMIAAHPEAAEWPLKGIINGIDGGLYSPSSADKAESRKHFYRMHGREDTGKPLFVTTGRLAEIKGSTELIAEASALASAGADLVVYGDGDEEYEKQLAALHEAGALIFVPHLADYFEFSQAMAAADFYLTPSNHEVCGLQPMKAARMGCVPIVRPVGGMGENFDETTAILITGTITDAVAHALALPAEEYAAIREKAMAGEWTWATRVLPWVELYGLETAPISESAFRVTGTSTAKAATYSRTETPATTESTTTKKASPFAKKGE